MNGLTLIEENDVSEEDEERELLVQRVRTPDGTILTSSHVHDYASHTDKVTGEEYMIDGGPAYCRCSVNKVPFERMNIYVDSPHEEKREYIKWGTRGPKGDQPLKYVSVAEMTSEHLQACLDTQGQMNKNIRAVMKAELAHRQYNGST